MPDHVRTTAFECGTHAAMLWMSKHDERPTKDEWLNLLQTAGVIENEQAVQQFTMGYVQMWNRIIESYQ